MIATLGVGTGENPLRTRADLDIARQVEVRFRKLEERIRQLESEPRVIAQFKGLTRVGGTPAVRAASGIEIRDTTTTHILFAFTSPAPSSSYHVSYTNCSGSTNANIGTIQAETSETFQLRIYDSSGALRDPTSLAFEFSIAIINGGA